MTRIVSLGLLVLEPKGFYCSFLVNLLVTLDCSSLPPVVTLSPDGLVRSGITPSVQWLYSGLYVNTAPRSLVFEVLSTRLVLSEQNSTPELVYKR